MRTLDEALTYKSSEYNAYYNMKQRCYWPKNAYYDRYGGRGITVCERWLNSFTNFIEDMGPKPSIELELDRKDNNGNYEPDNCRWATSRTQKLNRTTNNQFGISGVSQRSMNGIIYWRAYYSPGNRGMVQIYHGKDFFEACCARKSWEITHASEY